MGNLRLKAAEFFLLNDEKSVSEQLEILETGNSSQENDFVSDVDYISVSQPFQNETVGGLLEHIDNLEKEYNKIWNEALMLGYKNGSGETTLKI